MLAYYAKRSPGEEFEKIDKPIDSGVWVDGNQLTVEELNQVTSRYGLEPNIVYDVRDRQELPRMEFSDHDAYVFLRLPHLANSGHVTTSPLLCVVRPQAFFSLSMQETISPESIASTTLPISTSRTTDLLLGVIAAAVGQYEELLKHTERSINDTGSRLRTHEVTNRDFLHFVVVEDNLNGFRMNLGGLLAVVRRMKETEHRVMSKASSEALDDIALQIQQLLVAIESYGSRVESIRNAYSTIADNNLNRRMKTLTVLTVLITLPNVFFGMYGMNVMLPYAKQPWAFAAVMGVTAMVVLLVYLVAKRLRIF